MDSLLILYFNYQLLHGKISPPVKVFVKFQITNLLFYTSIISNKKKKMKKKISEGGTQFEK